MSVESSRSSECLVQRLREVGRGDDDDAFRLLETVKFDQKLIEGLLHVVLHMRSALYRCMGRKCSHLILSRPLATDSIQLIDEHDCWCFLPSRGE